MRLTRQDAFWLIETVARVMPQAFGLDRLLSSFYLGSPENSFFTRTRSFKDSARYDLPVEAQSQLRFELANCYRFILQRGLFTANFSFQFFVNRANYHEGLRFKTVNGRPTEEVCLCP